MKKFISLLLALVLCLSLGACGGAQAPMPTETPSADQTEPAPSQEVTETAEQTNADKLRKEASIQAFKEYIMEAGSVLGGVSVYTVDTGLTDVSFYAMVQREVVCFSLTYNLASVSSDTVKFTNQTLLYLTGYEHQQSETYYVHQRNSSTMGQTEFALSAGSHVNPAKYTVNSELDLVNIEKTENNANAEINDSFIASVADGLNTTLEIFADLLESSGTELTLADFGFEQYAIDETRASDIRSEAWAVPPVDPAPVSIQINDLHTNSAGTPELYVQFTNTGDTAIEALDFYVICYDAYGEVVKGYGQYSAYQGTYQESPIAPEQSTPSDWHWALYGFDNAKSVKIAIIKYKLAGETAVEIPENEFVWVQ